MHFDCISPQDEPDKRFHHFTTQLLPALLKSAVQSANTIVFIPSSFDFIRVHNWFRKQSGVSFAILSECVCFLFVCDWVSDNSKIGTQRIKISRVPDKPFSKAQNQYYSSVSDSTFTNGTFSHSFSTIFLLYSYTYYSYKIRGIRNLVFYGPPSNPQFFTEYLSYPFLDDGVEALDVTCKVLYSKFDWLRLERIVGTEAGLELIKGIWALFIKLMYLYCTRDTKRLKCWW